MQIILYEIIIQKTSDRAQMINTLYNFLLDELYQEENSFHILSIFENIIVDTWIEETCHDHRQKGRHSNLIKRPINDDTRPDISLNQPLER